jgi:hypothetical protein
MTAAEIPANPVTLPRRSRCRGAGAGTKTRECQIIRRYCDIADFPPLQRLRSSMRCPSRFSNHAETFYPLSNNVSHSAMASQNRSKTSGLLLTRSRKRKAGNARGVRGAVLCPANRIYTARRGQDAFAMSTVLELASCRYFWASCWRLGLLWQRTPLASSTLRVGGRRTSLQALPLSRS